MNPKTETVVPLRPDVHCPQCGNKVFDGMVIKARIIRVLPIGAEAKCRCKHWMRVPLVYSGINLDG